MRMGTMGTDDLSRAWATARQAGSAGRLMSLWVGHPHGTTACRAAKQVSGRLGMRACRHVGEEEEVEQVKSSCGWSALGGDNPGRRLDPCSHWPMAQHSTSTSPSPTDAFPDRACKPTLIFFSLTTSFHLFDISLLAIHSASNRPRPIIPRSRPTRTYHGSFDMRGYGALLVRYSVSVCLCVCVCLCLWGCATTSAIPSRDTSKGPDSGLA